MAKRGAKKKKPENMSSLWNLYHELGDILEHADREKGVRKQISGLERNLKKSLEVTVKKFSAHMQILAVSNILYWLFDDIKKGKIGSKEAKKKLGIYIKFHNFLDGINKNLKALRIPTKADLKTGVETRAVGDTSNVCDIFRIDRKPISVETVRRLRGQSRKSKPMTQKDSFRSRYNRVRYSLGLHPGNKFDREMLMYIFESYDPKLWMYLKNSK